MFSSIKVQAPATTANLGSSFDCLGLALELFNYIEISKLQDNQEDEFFYNNEKVSFNTLEPKKNNFIFKIIYKFFEIHKTKKPNISIKINNEIPLSRGLGSSSAAIASTLVAVNSLFFENRYSNSELLNFALLFEKHPDNLAPSFFGGLVASALIEKEAKYYKFLDFEKNFKDEISLLFVIPDYKIDTEISRTLLFNSDKNKNMSHLEYVGGLNNSILNIISFVNGDFNSLKVSMKDTVWHEEQRKSSIKFFDDIIKIAMNNGAFGTSISGSGPSILVIAKHGLVEKIKNEILKIEHFDEVAPQFFELKPNFEGVKILWKK